jgi:two-component system NarL family sensor kinase
MQNSKDQLIISVVAVVLVLLFLGSLFLIMLFYYNNKKMQLAREKRQLQDLFEKQLLQSRLEMQDQTFNTISQEIHDNVGQTLSLAKVQVGIMEERNSLDKTLLTEIKESISRAMTDLRDIAKSLNSQRLQVMGLVECISQELDRLKKTGSVNTSLTVSGEERKFEYQQKLILFRIIQETLQNIIKHAKATNVMVTIENTNSTTILIHDDGLGFDVGSMTRDNNGLGLQNIINRATLIGGSIKIGSIINEGTTVLITIPYV